ncbi:MAG: thiolase family protein [Cyclonatronaceae bacterium]
MKKTVLVDGCRIPFQRSGTGYRNLMAYDLARIVLKSLLERNPVDPAAIDRIIMGNVIQEVKTTNVAREAALGAGYPLSVPAHTVTMACISSNAAITAGMDLIRTGQADIVVAGGVETMSDVPIRLRPKLRKKLVQAGRIKGIGDVLNILKGLRPSDLLPELPSITEFSTRQTMGKSCDILAAKFGVSRSEQDEYALRSHQLAAKATQSGLFEKELVPALVEPDFKPVTTDNGVRGDSSMEKLTSLRPAFVKPHGTVTAGNSSFLTDGASATLIMSEEKCRELGLKPKAYLGQYTYVAQNPDEDLLLGPALAIPKVMKAAGLDPDDIDVFELHEAFAGQVLAVLNALKSESFAKAYLGIPTAFGEIPLSKMNTRGGSLSLGHPFGATGARLVTTAANRLIDEGGEWGLVAACAAGGLGHAIVLKRHPEA